MATLYVVEPGARVEKEYRHLVVTRDDEVILRLPLSRVTEVVLVGQGVGITTPALHALLSTGAGVVLVHASGRLLGRLSPPTPRCLPLRRAQYRRASEPAFCLELARSIVKGKLANDRALARRWTRRRPEAPRECLDRLDRAIEQAGRAEDLGSLRGIEGSGTKAYFALFRSAMRPELRFERRTRRPPQDIPNLLLSLGYTLLGEAVTTAIEVVGLDPYQGFYHAEKYGRPALALDLMEEFRAPVVDSAVLTCINKRVVRPTDVLNSAEGTLLLSQRARVRFLRVLASRLHATYREPGSGRSISYQKWLEVQARQLARCVVGEVPRYVPFRVR